MKKAHLKEIALKYETDAYLVQECAETTAEMHDVTPSKVVEIFRDKSRKQLAKKILKNEKISCNELYKSGDLEYASDVAPTLFLKGDLYIQTEKERIFWSLETIKEKGRGIRVRADQIYYISYLGENNTKYSRNKRFFMAFESSSVFYISFLEMGMKHPNFDDITFEYTDPSIWFPKLPEGLQSLAENLDPRIRFPEEWNTLWGAIEAGKTLSDNAPRVVIYKKQYDGDKEEYIEWDKESLDEFAENVKKAWENPEEFAEDEFEDWFRDWYQKGGNFKMPFEELVSEGNCEKIMSKFGIKNKKDLKKWIFKRHPDRTAHLEASERNRLEEEVKNYYDEMKTCATEGYFA